MSKKSNTYFRPKTRGELRDKLKNGVVCEVVAHNAGFTKLMLNGWLEFKDFTIRLSENIGWSVFEPTKLSKTDEVK